MLPPEPSSLRGIHSTARYLLAHLHLHSEETAVHSKRIATLAVRLGRMMGVAGDDLITLRYGTILHDVGKLDVPLEYLHKPGALEPHEAAVVNLHPQRGSEVARIRQLPDAICDAILFHHERFDGRGYPYGLQREAIPLASRIIAVVDTFDTIVHKRCYREARAVQFAREEIARCAGTQFDPEVAARFLELLEVIDGAALRRAMREDGREAAAA